MKQCPYCAEDILDEAIKCKHCGEWLQDEKIMSSGEVSDQTNEQPDEYSICEQCRTENLSSLINEAGICKDCCEKNIQKSKKDDIQVNSIHKNESTDLVLSAPKRWGYGWIILFAFYSFGMSRTTLPHTSSGIEIIFEFAGIILILPLYFWLRKHWLKKGRFGSYAPFWAGLTTWIIIMTLTFYPVSFISAREKKNATYYLNLGNSYSELGKDEEAIDAYMQAIKNNPHDADVYFMLGASYVNVGKFQEAINTLKESIRIAPDYDAYVLLCSSYVELGKYKDAVDVCKQAVKINPYDADVHFMLSISYFHLNNNSAAHDEYEILKDLDKKQANILFNIIYKNSIY